jgi:O-methyltransferase
MEIPVENPYNRPRKQLLKHSLNLLGESCSLALLWRLNQILDYLWSGHWFRSRKITMPPRSESKAQVFEAAASELRDCQVLYLEFGVAFGDSMRAWAQLLRNPDSILHGFDSFEGLPEGWDGHEKGDMSAAGAVPAIDDDRVTFFKGWFDETLASYAPPKYERLFINCDADLYSSTKTVLTYLRSHFRQGVYLYFDEFQSHEHEMKAFDEFLAETGLKFEVVAATRGLEHVLFRCTNYSSS